MFISMQGSWTIHVGPGLSHALYRVANPHAMVELLTRLGASAGRPSIP